MEDASLIVGGNVQKGGKNGNSTEEKDFKKETREKYTHRFRIDYPVVEPRNNGGAARRREVILTTTILPG